MRRVGGYTVPRISEGSGRLGPVLALDGARAPISWSDDDIEPIAWRMNARCAQRAAEAAAEQAAAAAEHAALTWRCVSVYAMRWVVACTWDTQIALARASGGALPTMGAQRCAGTATDRDTDDAERCDAAMCVLCMCLSVWL